jgi:phosphoribosylaminoimidazole carboxylase PurE protein
MGSDSDLPVMEEVEAMLKQFGITYQITVASAHRAPERAIKIAAGAEGNGIQVIIAGAGMAAHLAGIVAAHTILPVIGVPINSSPLNGLDSLLSTVQMPPGVPVAAMAIGKPGAKNAAILAAQIIGRKVPAVAKKLRAYKQALAADVGKKAKSLR